MTHYIFDYVHCFFYVMRREMGGFYALTLLHVEIGDLVHVTIVEVLAPHTPDEHIV